MRDLSTVTASHRNLRPGCARAVNLVLVIALIATCFGVPVSAALPPPEKPPPTAEPLFIPLEAIQGSTKAPSSEVSSPQPAATNTPPANDDFDHATAVGALPLLDVIDTTQATVAPDDPNMGCGAGVNSNTVWYRFTSPRSGPVIAHTIGSNYDTVLAVFTGTRGNLNLVACNDDAPGILQSQVSFNAQVGQTYHFEVADYGSPQGGTLAFSVHLPNDDFDDATPITGAPFQAIVDTRNATVAADDPNMGCGAGVNSNTIWYQFTASMSSQITAETFGSTYDTVLAVFTGSRGALNLVACSDDASGTLQSTVTFSTVAGETYYIEIADYGSPDGGFLLFTVFFPAHSLSNQFLQANAADDGRFVLGTTGGDPGSTNDDNKRLLYGYPSIIGTSFATLRVLEGGTTSDFMLGRAWLPTSGPTNDGSAITTIWEVDNTRVEQRLYFATNPGTGRLDVTAFEYTLTNTGTLQRDVGLRLLLDTMIGDNDGAPFFLPGWGRLTHEQDFAGNDVPDYWIAWESPVFDPDLLKAQGLLRGSDATAPDRVIVAHWDDDLCPSAGPGLFSVPWDYIADPGISIECDSAIALYFNPARLQPGQSRTVRTFYGLAGSGNGLALIPDVVDFVTASRQDVQSISQSAHEVATVGDYFLDKLGVDSARRVINLALNGLDLFTQGVSWARVGGGLGHIATPGYQASLHASWRGWADDTVAKHWYKPLYDALHNNRELLFEEVAWAGLKYYAKEAGIEAAKDPIKHWLLAELLPGPGKPIHDYLGAPASALADGYRSDLLREQDDMLAWLAVQPLTQQQITEYRADMQARQLANAQIATQLHSHKYLRIVRDFARKTWPLWGS